MKEDINIAKVRISKNFLDCIIDWDRPDIKNLLNIFKNTIFSPAEYFDQLSLCNVPVKFISSGELRQIIFYAMKD